MRKLVAELTTAAMVVSMVASPALGTTTNGSEVVNTGDKNTVVNNTNTTTSVVVSNNNTMQVSQTSVSNANTGDNQAYRNIGSTTVDTGNATTNTAQGVTGNTNATQVSMPTTTGGTNLGSVLNTGDKNKVVNNVNTNTAVVVTNNNDAYVKQKSVSDSNTGDNKAYRNAGSTTVSTGDAENNTAQGVNVNHNATVVGGAWVSPLSAGGNASEFVNTGDKNTVVNNVNNNTAVVVTNNNSLGAFQFALSNANTGDNKAYRNTGSTTVDTGDAKSNVSQGVWGNTNATSVAMDVMPLGVNLSSTTNTGNYNKHYNNLNTNTATIVGNNNNAGVWQFGLNSADAGYNYAYRNASSSTVSTGNAETGYSSSVQVNGNVTSVGGSWLGLLPWAWWMLL